MGLISPSKHWIIIFCKLLNDKSIHSNMGIFSNNELSINQIEKLNNMLPEKFRKQVWHEADFKGESSLFYRLDEANRMNSIAYGRDREKLEAKKDSLLTVAAMNIKVYNTVPNDAEQLGMIDVGVTTKFGASSTGDRFAGGFIGYAIESAIDDAWVKKNIQDNAVNEVKLKLLEKARLVYPCCNMIFNYDVDFREIGSSGNVFIYMRGTAAVGENTVLTDAVNGALMEIEEMERDLQDKKKDIENLIEVKSKIPKSSKEIEKCLGN